MSDLTGDSINADLMSQGMIEIEFWLYSNSL